MVCKLLRTLPIRRFVTSSSCQPRPDTQWCPIHLAIGIQLSHVERGCLRVGTAGLWELDTHLPCGKVPRVVSMREHCGTEDGQTICPPDHAYDLELA